jgi:3-dehydroquinate synthase
MRSGLAEMFKHEFNIKKIWEQFLNLKHIDYADFDQLIYRSVKLK